MIAVARTDYDEPTARGWLVGWQWLHVEVSTVHLHLRVGRRTLTVTRDDELERDEWEARL